MSSTPDIVLYRYDSSPFSVKVDNILLLKDIPHQIVNVSHVLPRPEITELLGVTYRRIPILAIGNDVYCDTSLIASALERRFPASQGYGTIFPRRKNAGTPDTGLIRALSKHWADTVLFPLGPVLLPWEKFPASFVTDRSAASQFQLRGAPVNVKALVAARGPTLSMLSTHLSSVEEQLEDGREWLFDTELPGLADVSIHFVFAWVKSFRARGLETLFDTAKFPHALDWMARMTRFLERRKQSRGPPRKLTGDEAAKLIVSCPFEPHSVVGFDSVEGTRLGLKPNDVVAISPDDTGKNLPTIGTLMALNKEEFVIETRGKRGAIRCHFPRILFTAKQSPAAKL